MRFKFAASEARKKFNSTSSADEGAIGEISGTGFLMIREKSIERSLARNKNYINTLMRIIFS